MRTIVQCILFLSLFASAPVLHAADASEDELFKPLTDRGIQVKKFTATVSDTETQIAYIASPPADKLAEDPLLLLTIGGASDHLLPPNNQATEYFLERGHRVVTISVNIMPGPLEGLRDDVLSGADPFRRFIKTSQAVLDHCVAQGWAKDDRMVVTGISRFGYLALRLMAADERLKVGAAFAPVTDWRYLTEFEAAKNEPKIADERLSNFADKLAGKKIYMAIGSHDERVSTVSACQLFVDLNAANDKHGFDRSLVDFNVTADPHHTVGEEWYDLGLELTYKHAISIN